MRHKWCNVINRYGLCLSLHLCHPGVSFCIELQRAIVGAWNRVGIFFIADLIPLVSRLKADYIIITTTTL